MQEMNISITNEVRNMVSEDLRYKSIVIRKGQSCSEVWDKEVWPPSSPDYSLLDYFVWGVSEL